MYNFIDVIDTSEGNVLPSEALQINGEYIENLISGYRTLNVSGREALSPELSTVETGVRDGSVLKSKRYPARTIIIKYQLMAKSNEDFRAAYNQLGSILNVEEAELIFNDEPDKFFIGTPSALGEVEPGKNAVIGEIEFICADPFKYSVIEYEAAPREGEDSILIDYNGTYKSFPTLEAAFFNEDENDGALTGGGDCGYVAFFNESEKIIQIGDPDEADTESYAKSQTLVNQKFNTETAWGAVAETNWVHNLGSLPSGNFVQTGNIDIAVGHNVNTVAPVTSGTLLTKRTTIAKPYVDYKVTAKTANRTADGVDLKVTITTKPVSSGSDGTTSIKAGAKITLNNTNLYVSSTAGSSAGKKSGTFYLWDDSVKNGRIRITDKASNAGKSNQVTGWVKVSDLNLTTATTFAKGVGLKGGIRVNNGEWTYVTIKAETANWNGTSSHDVTFTVKVKSIDADTTLLEGISFKVERTDDLDSKLGLLDETACKDFEISTYTAPVPGSWYLMPETYGTNPNGWHGPSITRTIPVDASGEDGAKNFTFSYSQKMAIGSNSNQAALREAGAFMALLTTASGKIVAGVYIYKASAGKAGVLRFFVNGKLAKQQSIDLSLNNKYFGNNNSAKNITTVKTSTIQKAGAKIAFNIGGIKYTFIDNSLANVAVTAATFYWGQYKTLEPLTYNGLYWAKFVKNNCDTFEDIPNKFSANDVVTADCKSGEIFLNDTPTPNLGALGNDWEDFYLSPGLNQIGFAYSEWVEDGCKPLPKIRYREVFL